MYQFSDLQEVHFDVVMISTLIREMVISLQPYTNLACVASVSIRIARKLEREQKENRRGTRKGGEETLQAVPSIPSPSPFIPFFALVPLARNRLLRRLTIYLYSFLTESQSISKRQGPVLKGLKNDMEVVLKLKLLPFRRHLFCFVFA